MTTTPAGSNGRTRRTLLGGLGALAAGGWTLGSCGGFALAAPVGGSRPVGVALATDVTGPMAPFAAADWQIFQIAAGLLNDRGGIAGRPIRLILRDTASDPAAAAGCIAELLRQPDVDAILGGGTATLCAAVPETLPRDSCVFHPLADVADHTVTLMHWSGAQGASRMALAAPDQAPFSTLQRRLRRRIEAAGGSVVGASLAGPGSAGLDRAVAEVAGCGADAVLCTFPPAGLATFARRCAAAAPAGLRVLAAAGFDELLLRSPACAGLEGLACCLPPDPGPRDLLGSHLAARHRQQFPHAAPAFRAGGTARGVLHGLVLYAEALGASAPEDVDAVVGRLEATTATAGRETTVATVRNGRLVHDPIAGSRPRA